MIIPFQDHTHLFIFFSFYLFTNVHDLSLSNLHLITYNLHPYHIYKYKLLTTYFQYIHSFLFQMKIHHFLFFHLLYSLFLIYLNLHFLPKPNPNRITFSSSHSLFCFSILILLFSTPLTLNKLDS